MNKSFQESNGTVLSTNWKDIGAKKVRHQAIMLCQGCAVAFQVLTAVVDRISGSSLAQQLLFQNAAKVPHWWAGSCF